MIDSPLMLSVSGVRGIVGKTMTPTVVHSFAAAFASFLNDKLERLPTICVARDSRPSGSEFKKAAIKAFLDSGCDVIDLGIVATPTAGVMIKSLKADGGIVITASHNPDPWNGIKCLNGDGMAPSKEASEEIINSFIAKNKLPLKTSGHAMVNSQGNDTHISKLLGVINPSPIRTKQYRVVLDSINGAGCESGLKLLELLGCEVLHLNGDPTGKFSHPPEPKEENLESLCEAVVRFDADVGFAQDPDADRLAIINQYGGYIGEEYTLALTAMRWLELNPGTVATNLSTSRMVDDIARNLKCKVYRSAVGEANVAKLMQQKGCVIGGEGNGGVIFPKVCMVRDSLAAMAMTLDLMQSRTNRLAEIAEEIPKYAMIKQTINLPDCDGKKTLEKEIERLKERYPNDQIDDSDGVRIDFEEGWIHLRASNTEPIVRIIAEAKDSLTAYKLANRIKLKTN